MAGAPYEGKRVEVEIVTDTYKIRGTVFVPVGGKTGYHYRLSDLLNNRDQQFLVLTDVVAESLPDPQQKWKAPFISVNKNVVPMVRAIKERCVETVAPYSSISDRISPSTLDKSAGRFFRAQKMVEMMEQQKRLPVINCNFHRANRVRLN